MFRNNFMKSPYFKRLSEPQQREIDDFLKTLEERDGKLKYQALVDYFRSKSRSSAFGVGHNPRPINPEGEEL